MVEVPPDFIESEIKRLLDIIDRQCIKFDIDTKPSINKVSQSNKRGNSDRQDE